MKIGYGSNPGPCRGPRLEGRLHARVRTELVSLAIREAQNDQRKSPQLRGSRPNSRARPEMDGAEMKTSTHRRKTLFNIQEAVCVVSKDEKTRSGLYMVLGTLGVRVATFSTAEEFLDQLNGEEPAILITDLVLPGMSGCELREALGEKGIQVPVIGLTGEVDPGEEREASQPGLVDLIERPFVYWSVVHRIKKILCLPRRTPFS